MTAPALRIQESPPYLAGREDALNSNRLATPVRISFIVATVLFAIATQAQQAFSGQWLVDRVNDGNVQFQLRYERDNYGSYFSSWSRTVPVTAMQGLSASELASVTGANVHFKLVRDAGTFNCDGWAQDGNASGHWTFVANPSYVAQLKQRGLSEPVPSEQFQMAMADITMTFVDELKSEGYHLELTDLIRAGQHGVTLEYVRGMKDAGYRFDDLEALTRMRDHGVTPKYVQEMASYGFKNLSAEDLRRMRDHGVTAEYLHALDQAGFKSMAADQAVYLRDHGVSSEYIAAMKQAGYGDLTASDLSHLRDHGVTPEFIAAMKQAGYGNLSASELSRIRDHGVGPDYIREMAEAGFSKLDPSELTRLRDHGVTGSYVRDLKAEGVAVSEVSEVVRMRDVGVSIEFVREAKSHGFDIKDPSELIRLRTRGMDGRASMF